MVKVHHHPLKYVLLFKWLCCTNTPYLCLQSFSFEFVICKVWQEKDNIDVAICKVLQDKENIDVAICKVLQDKENIDVAMKGKIQLQEHF